MNTLLKNLLLGGSATALTVGAAFTSAHAQGNAGPVPADDIETVNSSAGRLDLQGFTQPTPVTVIGIETLNRDAKVNIGDEIRELPQVRGGASLQTGAGNNLAAIAANTPGVDTVALRNLGAQRNLVLFDHQRVTSTTLVEGTVDLSLIPTGLVQRVDVVTGGASSAWGSDAVTGVINLVINKTYEGFKGNVTYSNSTEVSNPVYKASLAWGTSFLGGKGHIVAAADITHADADLFAGDVWRSHVPNGRGLVYNSAYCAGAIVYATGATTGGTCSAVAAGQPALIYAYGLGNTQTVVGGLIASNTNGTAGSPIAVAGNISGYGAGGGTYLKGVFFQGDNKNPAQFNYGTLYSSNSCYNGCTNNQFGTGGWGSQTNPYHVGTYFTYVSYQVLPDVKASVQLNYSRLSARIAGATVPGTNRVIYADNPFLPDQIAQDFVCAAPVGAGSPGNAPAGAVPTTACGTELSNGYNPYTKQNYTNNPAGGTSGATSTPLTLQQMQARPSQSFTANFEFSGNRENTSPSATNGVGVYNDATKFTWQKNCASFYHNCGWANKVVMRGVFTLDGNLGDDWTWTAYIQNSDARIKERVMQVISVRVNNALDAVRVTSGNVGTSGLPIGSIQCRALLNPSQSTLTNTPSAATGVTGIAGQVPSNTLGITTAGELTGCVPFDPFGNGEISAGTMAYVAPAKYGSPTVPMANTLTRLQQAAGAFSLQGVLPWKLPAGDVGVAFGAEWRLERQGQYNVDPRSQLNMYSSGNFGANWEGRLHTEEGFLEVDAPILKNQWVQSLDVSMAGRITNYSFSGLVETWKLGATTQINDDVKLRVTWSYDIRQPDVYDLYYPGSNSGATCGRFVLSNLAIPATNSCFSINNGNPNLVPEKAQTIAAGLVLTPTFLDGVTASIDWYQIHLHGALFTPGLTEPIGRCQNGDLSYCADLVFSNPSPGPWLGAQGCGTLPNGALNPNTFGCLGADTLTPISYVHTNPVNAALLRTAGFDFAVAYGFDLFTGSADVSFNGNYTYDFSRVLPTLVGAGAAGTAIAGQYYPGCTTTCNVNVDFQGIGSSGGYYSGGNRFRGNLNFNYREGAWSFGAQARILGDSRMNVDAGGLIPEQRANAAWLIPLSTIAFNKINGQDVAQVSSGQSGYLQFTNYNRYQVDLDLRASYRWSNNITLFGAVDNVQDLPSFSNGGQRRQYRVGVRWNY
ncbi:MAG: TonB-dependent receptor [Alphaproteobacteria bacterium]|nr:TonB-dependent receptor [Alphaproteobacteria bacterium]